MSDWSVFAFVGPLIALNLYLAFDAWASPAAVAKKNKEFIDSGRETYFEERRSWEAYGTTPETDPARVSRKAKRALLFNVVALAVLIGLAML